MNNSQEKSQKTKATLIVSTLKMASATFISRILGLVRELLIARFFGASGSTDAFFVAYRIPNLLRDLFAEGAFSSAFVPVFTKSKQSGLKNSQILFSTAFWRLSFITSILSLLIYFNADSLIRLFAPNFLNDLSKFALTVSMVKIVAPFLALISIAALFMGVLNTHKVFFLPSVMPAFLNLSVISSILIAPSFLKIYKINPIISLPIGIMFGGLFQVLLQIPSLLKLGYKIKLPIKKISEQTTNEINQITKKMGPGLIGFSINQINLLVNTILASGSIVGAVSWLNYAFRLFQFPVGIFSVSLGTSNLVHFSALWKLDKKTEAISLLKATLYFGLAIIAPITIITFLLGDWLINLVFEGGKFLNSDTLITAKALAIYAIGLPFVAFNKILIPVFYSIDKQSLPVKVSIASMIVNISISLSLIGKYGFLVLPTAMTVSIILNSSSLLYFLRKEFKTKESFLINIRSFKILSSSILVGIVIHTSKLNLFQDFFSQTILVKIIWLGLISFIATASYLLALYIFGEKKIFKNLVSKFMKK